MQYIRQRLGANLGRPSRTLLGRYALNWVSYKDAVVWEACAQYSTSGGTNVGLYFFSKEITTYI